jgi:S-DNA-T family DNA segregation ATPase FtsK/SpoIIIE
VHFPEAPPPIPSARLPGLTALLPLVVSVPLAWWLQQPAFLAFALLSPVMMLGQYLVDRHERRGERARAEADHRAAVDTARAELEHHLADERARLMLDHPDPAAVAAIAAGPLDRLWERRAGDPDETRLRLGLGSRPSALEVRGSPPDTLLPRGGGPPRLAEAPITLDLDDPAVGGVAGLAGPRREVLALARCLVGLDAVAGSPHRLRVVVLAPDGDPGGDWAWAAWLPHASGHLPVPPDRPSPAQAVTAEAPPGPRVLLVLDGAARLRRDPRVAALLASAGGGGATLALCLDDDPAHLPAECGATVEVRATITAGDEPGESSAVLAVRGGAPQPFRPDLVSPAWADRLARDLARLADATPAGADAALPAEVRLLDLVAAARPAAGAGAGARAEAARVDAARIAGVWAGRRAAHEPATTAVVGVTARGPWQLDLARHGPHALVAGTTGAGKSEFLITLVAALALAHPPDRLNLLLVDYKGGTAFGPLGGLPHTAGMLTDLDAHLARRALTSLRAELRRRERLLRAAGAADVDGYDRARAPGDPPMPRLLIVVDEFRVLAEELPDLLAGLVRVAVVGRSLGVHLVLATQRPAGVVTAEMRANVNLRIALRVRDRMDSEDVVEAPDAALVPPERPGRGVFRAGGGALVEFQAARATGRPAPVGAPARVRPLRRDTWLLTARRPGPPVTVRSLDIGRPEPGRPADPAAGAAGDARDARDARDDLAAVVAACREAASADGVAPARPPWLPPLPTVLRPSDVTGLLHAGAQAEAPPDPQPHPWTTRLVLGVADRPEVQARSRLVWTVPDDGHLAVVGAPGSGRSGVVRALVGAAARSERPVHVHVVDGGGRLRDLEGVSRLGTLVTAADTEHASRLLARLAAEARGPAEGRGAPGAGAIPVPVPVLLIVDGWEQVLDAWLPEEHGRLVDELNRLARDGLGVGVRLAVTGGRALLGGQLAAVLTERLLLRAADPTDLVLAGVPAQAVPDRMPPGRVLRLAPEGHLVEAQVVLDDPAADGACRAPRSGEPAPPRVAALPTRVDLTGLLRHVAAQPGGAAGSLAGGVLPVALGGDDAGPSGPPAGGPGWLVAGPAGSGRSTALATAVAVLRAAGRRAVVVADESSPLAWPEPDAGVVRVPPAAVRSGTTDLVGLLDHRPDATLVLDDPFGLGDPRLEDDLLARLDAPGVGTSPRWPAGPGPHVLAGCSPGQAAVAFRGLAARLRAGGAGLLLAPVAPGDGEAFGVRAVIPAGAPPGRALLITGPQVRAVQVAAAPTRRAAGQVPAATCQSGRHGP